MSFPTLLTLLVACDPHDAEVTGAFGAYLAAETSDNIARLKLSADVPDCQLADYAGGTTYDADGSDVDTTSLFGDSCYTQRAEADKAFTDEYGLVPIDCRDLQFYGYTPEQVRDGQLFNTNVEAECCVESLDADTSNDPDGDPFTLGDCTPAYARYFDFLNTYSYYLSTDAFDTAGGTTWREEAVLTTEGDLQLTVHLDTQFGDFRFGWVIDPDFAPTECVQDENGAATLAPVDGDWVDGWSSGADDAGYRLFHLNAYSVQINPSNSEDWWSLPEDWKAGYCFARFGDEDFYCHSTDYSDFDYYSAYIYGQPYWYGSYQSQDQWSIWDYDCGIADDCGSFSDYTDMRDALVANVQTDGSFDPGDGSEFPLKAMQDELAWIGKAPRDTLDTTLKVEENGWRPIDTASAAGLGGWGGISGSWVRFADNVDLTTLEPGKLDTPLEGDFQLYLESSGAASKLVVRGSFSITNITEDTWGYSPTLEEQKMEENDTPTCGE